MSSRCRNSLVALALVAALCSCDREERQSRGKPLPEAIPASASIQQQRPLDARAASYERNASAIAQGQQLFTWMNCVGCHSHGGGGMGPALMDDKWRYGARIDEIAASIMDGRPEGMPAWRGKLTEQQMWQLAAYVRSLSGQVRKDAISARADEMSNTPPLTQTRREPIRKEPIAP
jgi:cytochrome c oxidase cbb3-type subunit III